MSRDPEARAEAAELELERAHQFLDRLGVPRELREEGARDPLELSLLARLEWAFDSEEEE